MGDRCWIAAAPRPLFLDIAIAIRGTRQMEILTGALRENRCRCPLLVAKVMKATELLGEEPIGLIGDCLIGG